MAHNDRVGIVVAGAGARGAYEAGVLTKLVPHMGKVGAAPTVLVGTSAGALNVAALACHADQGWRVASEQLVSLWESVSLGQIIPVFASLLQDIRGYVGQVLGCRTMLPSLFDTSIQRDTLAHLLPLDRMHRNIATGLVDAVAVAATSTGTGGSVVFVETNGSVEIPRDDRARNIRYVRTELTLDHLLASAAVPVAFRPVHVPAGVPPAAGGQSGSGWYVDGGVRLNAPLKPAIKLGCSYLGVVATSPRQWPSGHDDDPADSPDVFRSADVSLRCLLNDGMIEDLHTVSLVNELLDHDRRVHGRHRQIKILFAGPGQESANELGALATAAYRDICRPRPHLLRHLDLWLLNRLIGGRADTHGDLLSFLLFEPRFARGAIELGARHAASTLDPLRGGKDEWPTG